MLKQDENYKNLKISYKYTFKKSNSMDVKFITLWTNDTFMPIPIYIYDKSLYCDFTDNESNLPKSV